MRLRGGSALASLVCACAAAAPTPAPSSAEVTIAYVFSAMFLDGLDCTLYDESTSADADGAFAAALVAVLGDYVDAAADVREIRLCAFSHYVDFTLAVDFEFAGYEQDDGQWNIVPDLIPAFQAAVADGSFDAALATSAAAAAPGAAALAGASANVDDSVAEIGDATYVRTIETRARASYRADAAAADDDALAGVEGTCGIPEASPCRAAAGADKLFAREGGCARSAYPWVRTRESERWCACDSRALCGAHFAEAVCCAPDFGACCDARVPPALALSLFLGAGAVFLAMGLCFLAARKRSRGGGAARHAYAYAGGVRIQMPSSGSFAPAEVHGAERAARADGPAAAVAVDAAAPQSAPAGAAAPLPGAELPTPLPRALSPVLTASEADAPDDGCVGCFSDVGQGGGPRH